MSLQTRWADGPWITTVCAISAQTAGVFASMLPALARCVGAAECRLIER